MDNKLLDECEKCLQDEPAASTATCPIHVDVVSFNSEIEKGDFKKAYKVLEKRMPFAGIFGMICDHPCEKACVRAELDSSISISELERATVSYGYSPYKKGIALPKKSGKVAVIGGGISGISAASELDKKGFQVSIYEKSLRLGGQIWDYEGSLIDSGKIEEELNIIDKMGISVYLRHAVSETELNKIASEYDAVFLGTGTWEKELSINPDTFQLSSLNIFVGGKLFTKNDSVINSVSSGKRAATSIERYIKKISITAAREREGSFITPMKFNMEDVEPAERTKKTNDIYSEEEAVKEAKRCLKCRCTECVNSCVHLLKFGITPKSYGRQIQINESVILGTRYANKMINSCTECGLCTERCPKGIGMDEIIHKTRESMVEKGKMPVSTHDFALKDMEFSNGDHFFTVKAAQGKKTDYLFYPGCQLSASYPEYVEKSYKYLTSTIKEGVGLMLGCCGAPADWAGRPDLMEKSRDRIRKAWIETDKPTFILACSSCSAIFEKFLPDIEYISLWEIFDKYGLPETAANGNRHILTVHDACASRHNNKIQESLRNIATKLGYDINELKYSKEKTKCCGYGGLVYYANREQSADFVKDRISESDKDYLVYCAMCKDLFVDGGKRTFHVLDLIFGQDIEKTALRKMPNLSERHANRAELKRKMLKEFWNEDMGAELIQMKNLIIPDDVMRVVDERYILIEDIEKVIKHSQDTGERFFNPQDLSYLANTRIGEVTYWVRYTEKDGLIKVLSVYSHRMEIKKD